MKFNDFLDIKTKIGLALTFLLLIASITGFIFAYAKQTPTDTFSMLDVTSHYFFLVDCITGLFLVGSWTAYRYRKKKREHAHT